MEGSRSTTVTAASCHSAPVARTDEVPRRLATGPAAASPSGPSAYAPRPVQADTRACAPGGIRCWVAAA